MSDRIFVALLGELCKVDQISILIRQRSCLAWVQSTSPRPSDFSRTYNLRTSSTLLTLGPVSDRTSSSSRAFTAGTVGQRDFTLDSDTYFSTRSSSMGLLV